MNAGSIPAYPSVGDIIQRFSLEIPAWCLIGEVTPASVYLSSCHSDFNPHPVSHQAAQRSD